MNVKRKVTKPDKLLLNQLQSGTVFSVRSVPELYMKMENVGSYSWNVIRLKDAMPNTFAEDTEVTVINGSFTEE